METTMKEELLAPLPADAPAYADKAALAEIMTLAGFPMRPRSIQSWPEVQPAYWAGGRGMYRMAEVHAAATARISKWNPREASMERARGVRGVRAA
jgi:hypothetical protein